MMAEQPVGRQVSFPLLVSEAVRLDAVPSLTVDVYLFFFVFFTFLLLLFTINGSSVKLLAVIKYFHSPLVSLILNNKITPGRLTVP